MKRVLSLLIALVTAFGVSTAAFAAVDDDIYFSDTTQGAQGRLSPGYSEHFVFGANELLIVDRNNVIVGPEYDLTPGEENTFRIYRARAADTVDVIDNRAASSTANMETVPVTALDLAGGKFRLRAVKGTSTISSAKIERKGSGNTATYNLVVVAKENWGTKMTDVEYNLSVLDAGVDATELAMGTLAFKVGYGQYTDEQIDDFSEGDIITISNDKPVITKKQFTELAKNYNYKNIQFEAENGNWTYIGKVSGMADTNFTYTHNVVPSIVTKFEDQDFKFLTFGAGVNFPTNGEMRIDVSDVSDDFTRMYTYLYRDGKLTPINTTYDTGADEIVFRTNYLGSFVMTNEEITDRTIIEQNPGVTVPAETEPTVPTPGVNNHENPGTGASHGIAVATTLGIVSLAAAATVSRKKR